MRELRVPMRKVGSKDRFVPGKLRSWELSGDKKVLLLRFDAASAEICLDSQGTVRVRAVGGAQLGPDPAEAVVRNPLDLEPLRVTETDNDMRLVVEARRRRQRTASVDQLWRRPIIIVDGERAAIEGRLASRQKNEPRQGSLGRLWAIELLEFSSGGAAKASLVTDISASYWGFGEKTGPLDKRGLVYKMRTRDMPVRRGLDPLYAAIPFFMWSRPLTKILPYDKDRSDLPPVVTSGCLLECFAPSRFDISHAFEDRMVVSTQAWGLDLTIFPGPTPKQVLERYVARTGLPPLPPLWAVGYHQSRWSYETESEVMAVADGFLKRNIPLDAIYLDIDYMDSYKVFTWDKRRFPDPVALSEKLKEMGVHLVAIVDPGVKVQRGYDVFEEGKKRGVFCRRDDGRLFTMWVWPREAAFVDFNDAEGRRFWGEMNQKLFEAGISGIWNDMNEPAGWRFDVRVGKLILPLVPQNTSRMRQLDPTATVADDGRAHVARDPLIEHEAVRNIYAYQECRALAEHLEKTRPDQRYYMLTRSGYAGIQRFAAMWTGDTSSLWSHLALSVPMLLGLSLSGVGFCGSDIGGFIGRPTSELYARWIQLGSLYPLARTHTQGVWGRQEPWSFGPDVERIAKDYISLRMRLLAYYYGLFAEYSRQGIPPWRALFLEFPEVGEAYGIEDEVMLGSSFLIAPILSKKARSRSVFFPPGEWIPVGCDLYPRHLSENARYIGPSIRTVDAPLDWMPFFVKTGSVVPSLWAAKSTAEIEAYIKRNGRERPDLAEGGYLGLKVYCSSPSFLRSRTDRAVSQVSAYYEDDFCSTAYKKKEYALFRIESEQRLESSYKEGGEERIVVRVSVSDKEGTYEPRLGPVRWEILCPPSFEPVSLLVDQKPVEWDWNESSAAVTLQRTGPLEPGSLEVVLRRRPAP